MADFAAGNTRFRAGRVVSRSFSTLFRNFASFGLLALVISAPPYLYRILAGGADEFAPEQDIPVFWPELSAEPFAFGAVGLLLGYLIMAALTYGTMQDLKGGRASLGECFSRGLALILPALGVGIVVLLVLALVALVTFVPGAMLLGVVAAASGQTSLSAVLTVPLVLALYAPTIYVWVMLWVAIPVAVMERRGLGSLKRSRALTKGYRWGIFFLLVLLLFLGAGTELLRAAADIAVSASEAPGAVAVEWIASAFINALSAVIVAVAYHDLRVAKEGADTNQIASVFD